MDDKIRDLIDQNEIQQLLRRYTEMVDKRDWKRMDQIFSTDGSLDYTSSGGVAGDYRSTLDWLARALEPWPLNLHYITNFDIEIEAHQARSSCYFWAPMGRKEPDGSQILTTNAGYYHDQLIRTEAGWRIADRVCEQIILVGLPEEYVIPS